MTNDKMITNLMSSSTVRDAILSISKLGELNEESMPSMISPYHHLCGVFCARLFEMKVHENEAVHITKRIIPFITLGQPGGVEGVCDDLILHLLKEAGVDSTQYQAYVDEQIINGGQGTPNLIHGILNISVIGSYLQALNVNQLVDKLQQAVEMEESVMAEVEPIFGGKVH